ncbi:sugar ABC transporter substrate-binding protein [Streptococcus azizii]|uniref:Sugar ABC transporter substrate-binding protein n=1 Tax=Streptococcus azizii TaxID=1579424 RepID=A0AB36JQP7_9STRE|nr:MULTISPECIES: sugar ABC transporter substrate-binding protein [Streptococcus]MBF0776228.1 sugar ABC transporter substrate-binding protein [Streptococcus sp. 19428wD3_AN2]ONK28086.1 sugar ABC transporter substrate-binding protein [Streptococcus azizii]ONK30484.1 sugar ABC transporter substrate-binding protein [Streptococcus azizii]ONK31037.1 sugar ABC transporter substrate-binding protein [Streptococcus azizii]TFU83358.1 sugar ABC transporter substrate-binding protein [Streptococcus sp. AN2]
MKIFKKTTVAVALLSTFVLTACGNSSSSSGNDSDEKSVILWVQYSEESAEGQVMAQSIKDFNANNGKGYTAKVEYIPRSGSGGGYEDKVNAALTTNTLPDVLTLDGPNTAAYAKSGILAPIDEYISNRDDLLPSIVEEGTYDGKLYSLGYSESGVGIFYNKKMLQDAGVDLASLPTVDKPWTYDQYNTLFATLTKHYNKPAIDVGFDDHSEWLMYAFTPFIWSSGGDVVTEDGTKSTGAFDNAGSVEAFTFIQGLIKNGYSTITPEKNGFQTGVYPLKMTGSWTMQEMDSQYKDVEYGVLPLPMSPKTKKLVSPTGSWAYGMSRTTKKKEAAGALIDFLGSEQEVYDMSVGNSVLPSRKSTSDRLATEVSEQMKVLLEQNAKTGQARPVLVNYPQVSRVVQNAVTEVTYTDQNPDVAALLKQKAQEIDGFLP